MTPTELPFDANPRAAHPGFSPGGLAGFHKNTPRGRGGYAGAGIASSLPTYSVVKDRHPVLGSRRAKLNTKNPPTCEFPASPPLSARLAPYDPETLWRREDYSSRHLYFSRDQDKLRRAPSSRGVSIAPNADRPRPFLLTHGLPPVRIVPSNPNLPRKNAGGKKERPCV
jgi:hypothetical protein